jgi:hypothetical protein
MQHFNIEEFACHCCGKIAMDEAFLARLEKAREIAGVPFKITSGYRCPKHNAVVGMHEQESRQWEGSRHRGLERAGPGEDPPGPVLGRIQADRSR